MQKLYLSIRYLLIGYTFCAMGWFVEDLIQPLYPNLLNYFKASYVVFYVLMMYFVTMAIFSLEKKSKTLRISGWLIIVAMILAIWSTIPQKENQQDMLYGTAGLFSFMSGYYIVVEYSKIVEKSTLVNLKKLAHRIRKAVAFADIFFILLLVPLALSVFPNLTSILVTFDLYIYYIIWICFIVFLILCIMEIKKELKQETTDTSNERGINL